jgi:hypothetical protein
VRGAVTVNNEREDNMVVKIIENVNGNPPGKLADAELHFGEGPLDGLKLIGFGIWERHVSRDRSQYHVPVEARQMAESVFPSPS